MRLRRNETRAVGQKASEIVFLFFSQQYCLIIFFRDYDILVTQQGDKFRLIITGLTSSKKLRNLFNIALSLKAVRQMFWLVRFVADSSGMFKFRVILCNKSEVRSVFQARLLSMQAFLCISVVHDYGKTSVHKIRCLCSVLLKFLVAVDFSCEHVCGYMSS